MVALQIGGIRSNAADTSDKLQYGVVALWITVNRSDAADNADAVDTADDADTADFPFFMATDP